MDTIKKLFECGGIPVIKIDDASKAVPLCEALEKGMIDVAEITFRTEAAEEAIRNVSEKLPNVLVGAGTVLNIELVKKAVNAGAKFIVTPGFNEEVVQYCLENNIPIIPGVANPSDIERAIKYGLEYLKFFPAEANGGIKALKAMAAPYGSVKFMPTGGINLNNISDYLTFDKIIACGGTFMIDNEALQNNDFETITNLAKQSVKAIHNFKLENIKFKDSDSTISKLFELSNGINVLGSVMSSDENTVELKSNNRDRAFSYFKRKGLNVKQENGQYIVENINGFKINLV